MWRKSWRRHQQACFYLCLLLDWLRSVPHHNSWSPDLGVFGLPHTWRVLFVNIERLIFTIVSSDCCHSWFIRATSFLTHLRSGRGKIRTKTSRLLLCAYPACLAAVERTQHLLLLINKNSLRCRSFFELLLFFSKEEFLEKPLKDILDSFQVRKTHWLMSIIDGQTQTRASGTSARSCTRSSLQTKILEAVRKG